MPNAVFYTSFIGVEVTLGDHCYKLTIDQLREDFNSEITGSKCI